MSCIQFLCRWSHEYAIILHWPGDSHCQYPFPPALAGRHRTTGTDHHRHNRYLGILLPASTTLSTAVQRAARAVWRTSHAFTLGRERQTLAATLVRNRGHSPACPLHDGQQARQHHRRYHRVGESLQYTLVRASHTPLYLEL